MKVTGARKVKPIKPYVVVGTYIILGETDYDEDATFSFTIQSRYFKTHIVVWRPPNEIHMHIVHEEK